MQSKATKSFSPIVSDETMARITEEFKARRAMFQHPGGVGRPFEASHPDSSTRFLFGGDFELDLGAYELRFSGEPRKLSRIPMEMLQLLIEQQGRLVNREEIVQKIWGEEVVVDTDRNINETVRRIRKALNEDSERPRFLQTVHGKGYRFIAPVIRVEVPC
ncbi:MAG TPA: winged helix-turn-helix domain-containing protein [Verrucomicrobiae bacterium]|nr:winged helix-turn-helix domain-containing protein [Verrucomicrobiae bacterium]